MKVLRFAPECCIETIFRAEVLLAAFFQRKSVECDGSFNKLMMAAGEFVQKMGVEEVQETNCLISNCQLTGISRKITTLQGYKPKVCNLYDQKIHFCSLLH